MSRMAKFGEEMARDWNHFRAAYLANLADNLSDVAYNESVKLAAEWFAAHWVPSGWQPGNSQ